jgi:hypothetical protein
MGRAARLTTIELRQTVGRTIYQFEKSPEDHAMTTPEKAGLHPNSWKDVLRSAFQIFRNFEEAGLGTPPFFMGGGTVLMLRWKHRLSKDIDFFGYDAQWITMLSPRLNDHTQAMAVDYVEQANGLKIVMPHGDIDFIVSGDVMRSIKRQNVGFEGRRFAMDTSAEILAKKMFHRAAAFKPRDVYDMSAALDIEPEAAHAAIEATASKRDVLKRRLLELSTLPELELLTEIVPYGGSLAHAEGMIRKVLDAIEPSIKANPLGGPPKNSLPRKKDGYER